MADINALKKQIRAGKQIVPMDQGVLDVLNKFDKGFTGFLEKYVVQMAEQIKTSLLTNEDLMYELAMIAYRQIPMDDLKQVMYTRLKADIEARKDLKGKNGDTPTDEHILELITPLIPKPVKGDTPSKQELVSLIKPLIPEAKNPFPKEKEEALLNAIEQSIDEAMTGKSIVDKINNLSTESEFQIDAKHIKNLPKATTTAQSTPLHRGGLKLIWNTELSGSINGVNTVFTVPSSLPDPKDDKYIVEARGVMKSVTGGDFTISNSNRTVTFTVAPPNGSARPRIVLYHGK